MDQTPQTPPTPTRLSNVFADVPIQDCTQVSARIPAPIYDYLFRGLLAGPKGPCQAILSHFFKKLYDKLHSDLKLPPCWDPENPELITKLLLNLNFDERIAVPVPQRSAGSRRPTVGSSKPSPKPKPGDSNTGGAGSGGAQVP